MNYLLSINKRLVLILSLVIAFLIIIGLTLKIFQSNINSFSEISNNLTDADITKPKFTINGNSQEIAITASKGNFLSDNKIFLEDNVIFKSKKFKIYSDKVIFDKKNMVASSKYKSKFVSNKTSIISDGFDITDNGNIINFKGKTNLTLKWKNY